MGTAGLRARSRSKAALRAEWRYEDLPGGLGGASSYGERTHRSEILLLRTAAGVAWEITPELSFGASLGLLYNENRLSGPYTVQSQPILRGAKTLLDLEADGLGLDAQLGVLWKPAKSFRIGASYTFASSVDAEGRARTDARRQLADLGAPDAPASGDYDVEVRNRFPQQASVAVVWEPLDRLALAAQVDWTDWSEAFDSLEVRFRNGENETLAELLGEDRFDDRIPLRWRDQWVARFGVEYALNEQWTARAGYAWTRSPVPSETLTPLTAAIAEHTVSAGVGYRLRRFSLDAAWQWALPNSQSVTRSELLSDEYSRSEVEISAHTITATAGFAF